MDKDTQPDPFAGIVSEGYSDGELVSETPAEAPEEASGDDTQDMTEEATEEASDEDSTEQVTEEASDEDSAEENSSELPKGLKKRLSKLSQQRDAERTRAAALEAELAQYRKPQEPPPQEQPKPVEVDLSDLKKPEAKDFKYGEIDPNFITATTEYAAEVSFRKMDAKRTAQIEEAQKAERAKAEVALIKQRWVDNVGKKGQTEFTDFEAKVTQAGLEGKYPLTRETYDMIVDSPVGHRIAYHLASNPEDAQKLASLPPHKQGVEFGKLEARFTKPSPNGVKEGRNVSAAPPPATSRVKGGGTPQTTPPELKGIKTHW